MKAAKLNLTNFRGTQSLQLEFHERLNVFYGVNGAGKSTVLDAIAIMLSWAVNRIRHSGAAGRAIEERDITNGKSASSIVLSCKADNRTVEWQQFPELFHY